MGWLAKIDVRLMYVQGAQAVDHWPPGKVSDEQRSEYIKEMEERISKASHDAGMKMVRFIHGEPGEPGGRRDRRRKWSDWEI